MCRVIIVCLLLLSTSVSSAWCDCGSIPFKPWVSVYEPNQRAIIGFNGREEILILSTDLRASEPTKVLEILPLPSKPTIKKCDPGVFRNATELINRKLFPQTTRSGAGGGLGGATTAQQEAPAGQVVEVKRIGAHNISVTHVIDSERFIEWAQGFLREQGADEVAIPEGLKAVVQDYLDEKYQWFAFDVVDLGTETVTKDAILYRFDTRDLYYPLRVTRAEKGHTKVRLLILTPDVIKLPAEPDLTIRLVNRPVELTRSELRHLNADLFHLLRRRVTTKLRIWETEGQLSSFTRDILTR